MRHAPWVRKGWWTPLLPPESRYVNHCPTTTCIETQIHQVRSRVANSQGHEFPGGWAGLGCLEMSSSRGIKHVEAVSLGQKVDKRNIRYWEQRGLPAEGILMNKKMLLCRLTPDKVLWKHFTKMQGALQPDSDMPESMKRNMCALYEKVFERELSIIDGKVSMKFGRAFLAQELRSKRFNWAQYALSEHVRISERNTKKVQRKRFTRQMEGSDQDDDDGTYSWEDDEEEPKYQPPPPARRLVEQHDKAENRAPPVPPGCSDPPCQTTYASTGPEAQCSPPTTLDADLQALRADLKRKLRQTHVMQEILQEFDSHILQHMSDKSRVEQEKEDLNMALSLVKHKCELLESNIYFVVGRMEMEKTAVDEGHKKLEEVIARKPTDPATDYAAWKQWCSDLQQRYKHLGYARQEVVEQGTALKKLNSEYEVTAAERQALYKRLFQLGSNTPESVAESDDPSRGLKSRRLRL